VNEGLWGNVEGESHGLDWGNVRGNGLTNTSKSSMSSWVQIWGGRSVDAKMYSYHRLPSCVEVPVQALWCVYVCGVCITGSGSLAAMAVFEDGFKPDMEVCTCNLVFTPFIDGT
jgi:hypothetical protein